MICNDYIYNNNRGFTFCFLLEDPKIGYYHHKTKLKVVYDYYTVLFLYYSEKLTKLVLIFECKRYFSYFMKNPFWVLVNKCAIH